MSNKIVSIAALRVPAGRLFASDAAHKGVQPVDRVSKVAIHMQSAGSSFETPNKKNELRLQLIYINNNNNNNRYASNYRII